MNVCQFSEGIFRYHLNCKYPRVVRQHIFKSNKIFQPTDTMTYFSFITNRLSKPISSPKTKNECRGFEWEYKRKIAINLLKNGNFLLYLFNIKDPQNLKCLMSNFELMCIILLPVDSCSPTKPIWRRPCRPS